MRKYLCHKTVEAFKIEAIIRFAIDGVTLEGSGISRIVPFSWIAKHSPKVGGYFVKYEDGYTSYSPPDVFESGYTLIQE